MGKTRKYVVAMKRLKVRDLRCLHPCGEYENGKEKRRRNGNESAQRDKPLDG